MMYNYLVSLYIYRQQYESWLLNTLQNQDPIKIRVYLPPYIRNSNPDQIDIVELSRNSTLKELFIKLKVPLPGMMIHLCRVNYDKATLNQTLNDGDTVSFYSLISGG